MRKEIEIDLSKSNPPEACLYGLALSFALVEREISEVLRPYRLTPAKFNTLMIIKHLGRDQGLSQVDICRQLIVTASNITRLLDKLKKEGLIERLSLAGDRRVNRIRITPKGALLLDKAWPQYISRVNEIGSLLSREDLSGMARLIGKWYTRLQERAHG